MAESDLLPPAIPNSAIPNSVIANGANDNEGPDRQVSQAATGTCPLCGKPRDPKYRPFCSKHCADVDLARWLGGRYAIPARPDQDGDDTADDQV